MNLNDLAKAVSVREGGVHNLPIAQVKEVMRHTLDLLAERSDEEVLALIRRRRKSLKK